MSDLPVPSYLRVPREHLYTERDPHAAERRAFVAQYPGVASIELEPIEAIRSRVENCGKPHCDLIEWLYNKPSTSRYAELFEAPPPPAPRAAPRQAPKAALLPKPALTAAQREELERLQLACAPELDACARAYILDPMTPMQAARASVSAAKLNAAAAASEKKLQIWRGDSLRKH